MTRWPMIALREAIQKEACYLDVLLSGTLTIFDGRRRKGERQSALMQLQGFLRLPPR